MPLMTELSQQGSWIVSPVFDQETGGQTLKTGAVIRLNKISHGSSTTPACSVWHTWESSMRTSDHVAWRPSIPRRTSVSPTLSREDVGKAPTFDRRGSFPVNLAAGDHTRRSYSHGINCMGNSGRKFRAGPVVMVHGMECMVGP